ncbi:alkaline phosphatase D family protein [Hydrogenophaga sp.]|uniref:alkaline phosphatase D family protein n=1 Tax=Hydrogenophaga sp. TaxID=1904254 RepID=UPI003F702B3B
MTTSSRRTFIVRLVSVSAAVSAGGVLSACGGGGGDDAVPDTQAPARFDFGVASGDPLADRVILWTHATRGDANPVALTWEVALDAGFAQVVSTGQTQASPDAGHTAKVDAAGLQAGQGYFFRFRAGEHISPVGRTRTLPAMSATSVKLAVFSCANYPAGFFHAYSGALSVGAEYAVHLGDYIYEYEAGGYASEDAVTLGRVSVPANECLTLADYRARYAQYRSDPDLKQLHATLPMIAIWDDHEIAENASASGSINHTEGAEGTFSARAAAAAQAYHEWLPIRTPDSSNLRRAYRSFDFGSLLSLHMLETRLLAREPALTIAELTAPATSASALAALNSPTRQMLGAEQTGWLTQQMTASSATWQVLGQQVLMARMMFPASVLASIDPATDPVAGAAAVADYLLARELEVSAPQLMTPEQLALVDPVQNPKIGYNLDAWDGYPAAREAVLSSAAGLGKRLVSLAGDTHNAWQSDLSLADGTVVGQEFAAPSVTSPGFEAYLGSLSPTVVADIFTDVVDMLNFVNTERRGFLLMSFTAQAVQGDWYFVDTVKSSTHTVALGHTAVAAA